MSKTIQIAIVGSGYVGLVAADCFAEIGHNVICVDNDEHKVAALEAGGIPIHEKHLPELLQRYCNTKIRFTAVTSGCCGTAQPRLSSTPQPGRRRSSKHASNAFLTLKISFINSDSNLCWKSYLSSSRHTHTKRVL